MDVMSDELLHLALATFNVKYHATKNPAAAKRDTINPCRICGWAQHMAIHDARNTGEACNIGWAHIYMREGTR